MSDPYPDLEPWEAYEEACARIAELESQLAEARGALFVAVRNLKGVDVPDKDVDIIEAALLGIEAAMPGDEDELTAQIMVEEQIKEVDRELMEVRGASRGAPTLEEKLSWQKRQRELEGRRSTLRRELFRLMDLESE